MNELQRQHYLSALGIDSYMLRMHLPYAPVSVACEWPIEAFEPSSSDAAIPSDAIAIAQSEIRQLAASRAGHLSDSERVNSSPVNSSPVNSLIGDFLEPKRAAKAAPSITSAADILTSLDTKTKPVTIEPFSLSIWRPLDGLLVIDSRNTKLALPTEQFLKNILRAVYLNQPVQMQEEVLRWPMIENSFAKRTLADARNELQTWLAVQCEIRPVKHIWLMGQNAAAYLLQEQDVFADVLFASRPLAELQSPALVLPGLNELLQQKHSKAELFNALRAYHKPT